MTDEADATAALTSHEQRKLARLGVAAEVTGLLVRNNGEVVDAIVDRIISVSEQQLREAAYVVALATGAARAEAVDAVLRSGLVTTLVTHSSLAQALLAASGQ